MRRTFAAFCLLMLVAGCGIDRVDSPSRPTLVFEQPPLRSVLEVPPHEMLQAVREGYHPPPDRRFLLAVAQMEHLITGEPAGELRSSFGDAGWTISYKGRTVGTLPELPDYADAARLLRHWIQALWGGELPVKAAQLRDESDELERIRSKIAAFEATSVTAGLQRLDERWRASGPSAELLTLGAQGLIALVIQSYDVLEIGDALPGKALAALTLAQALTGEDLTREEALLTYHLGYTSHAQHAASALPVDDPVRAYVSHRDDALAERARAEGAAPLVRYLHALRLAERRDPEQLASWNEAYWTGPRFNSVGQLKPAMSMRRFSIHSSLSPHVPYIALYELWKATGQHFLRRAAAEFASRRREEDEALAVAFRKGSGVDQSELAGQFEGDLAEVYDDFNGPFLDGDAYAAYLSGHFYSAIWQTLRHVLDGRSSGRGAETWARTLEDAPEGVAAELHRWYFHLSEAANGRPSVQDLLSDIEELEHLGEVAMERTLEELKDQVEYGDLTPARAAKLIAWRLDTRVSHQFALGELLRYDVRDLRRAEAYYRSVLKMSPIDHPWLSIWMARYDDDIDRLLAFIDDAELPIDDRTHAFDLLTDPRPLADDSVIREKARRLLDADPDYWDARSKYLDYLEEQEDYAEALRVTREWLERNEGEAGSAYIFARTAMARFHYYLGEHETAWEWVQPVNSSFKAGTMGRAALIEQALGEHERALRRGRLLVERYPTSAWARSVLAEILWRQRRYDEVAPVVNAPGYPISPWDWRDEIATAFLNVFADQPVEEAATAFAALIRAGISTYTLEDLSAGVSRAGRKDIAFAIQSQLRPTRAIGSLRHPLWASGYLRELRDEEEGLEWLRRRIPRDKLNPFSLVAYTYDRYDLLWTLITRPERGRYPSSVWLTRAAAYVASGKLEPPYRTQLFEHFREPAGDDYHAIGRYLLGFADESEVLALATTRQRRCEIAYYVGLKAKSEGRIPDAADWFRVALETESESDYEHGWADDELRAWTNARRSLAVQAAAERSLRL